jgi:hypothetical protein
MEPSVSYDYGEVPKSVIVKMLQRHVIFYHLKPFYKHRDDYCHLRVEWDSSYEEKYDPNDKSTQYYFINIYIDGEMFFDSMESKFGSDLNYFLNQLKDEIEEQKKDE